MFCSIRVCSGSKTRRTHLASVELSKSATGSGSIGVVEWQEQLLLPEASNVVDLEMHIDLFEGPKERDKTCFEALSRKVALLAVGSPLDFPEHWDGGDGRFRLVGFSTFMARKKDATDGQPRFTKHKIQDSTGQLTGELELGLRFTPCLLEGFLSQKSGGLCSKFCMGMFTCLSGGDWTRSWFQLLGDGTLLSWSSPSQRASSEPTCIFVGTDPSCCTGISLIGGGNGDSEGRDQFRVDFGGGGVWRFKAANQSQAKVWAQAMEKLWVTKGTVNADALTK